jgi:hypothetical protein
VALPSSTEAARTTYLKGIVEAAAGQDVMAWPSPNDDDLVLFARIIGFYSGIDFSLRYVAEIMDWLLFVLCNGLTRMGIKEDFEVAAFTRWILMTQPGTLRRVSGRYRRRAGN